MYHMIKISIYICYYMFYHMLFNNTQLFTCYLYDENMYNDLYQMCPSYSSCICFNFYNFTIMKKLWEVLLFCILYFFYIM